MVGRLLSYWEGNFSGAMLNLGRVNIRHPEKVSSQVKPSEPLSKTLGSRNTSFHKFKEENSPKYQCFALKSRDKPKLARGVAGKRL